MVLKNDELDLETINQSSLEDDVGEVTNQNPKGQVVSVVEEFNFYFALN